MKKLNKKFKWLYHSETNLMALILINVEVLPYVNICEEHYTSFYSYSYNALLSLYGWEEIGEL